MYVLVPKKSWSEWLTAFIEAGASSYYNDGDGHPYETDDWENMDPMPGGDDSFYADGDLDDGILESLAIIALAAALMILVVYRRRNNDQQRQQANNADGAVNDGQRNGQQQPGLQPDGGLFPQPDDPEFPGWVVGGIGH
jgi:SEL1 protein